jgi:hypothetical protein
MELNSNDNITMVRISERRWSLAKLIPDCERMPKASCIAVGKPGCFEDVLVAYDILQGKTVCAYEWENEIVQEILRSIGMRAYCVTVEMVEDNCSGDGHSHVSDRQCNSERYR